MDILTHIEEGVTSQEVRRFQHTFDLTAQDMAFLRTFFALPNPNSPTTCPAQVPKSVVGVGISPEKQ